MDFRPRIKEILKEKGIMQKNLAKRLGITEIGLSQTLAQSNPQLQTLERIAAALGVGVVDLFIPATPQYTCPHCGRPIEVEVRAI